jgi:hypothetical protein
MGDFMRQIAVPAALGCGCLFGGATIPLRAAEWSLTPLYSAAMDYDTNRRLELDPRKSEAAILTADLSFKRALEDGDISIEPRYSLRRYSDSSLGNGDDRSVFAAMNWSGERTLLNTTASYWDQSTLLTELLETGIVSGDTHRRLAQVGSNLTWAQLERWLLVAQISFADVKYHGQEAYLLPGYKYPSGSLGERLAFSEKGSITLSAFGSMLSSSARGNSSRETGVQAELIYSFSERTHLDASIGESQRVLTGQSGHGTDVSVSLTHSYYVGNVALSYVRSLVPYGTGFLVQRDQTSFIASRPLSSNVDVNLSLLRIQNNRATVELGLDRQSYDSITTGINWHPRETLSVGAQAEALRTQLLGFAQQNVHEYRAAVTVTWTPHPISRSW